MRRITLKRYSGLRPTRQLQQAVVAVDHKGGELHLPSGICLAAVAVAAVAVVLEYLPFFTAFWLC